MASSRNWPNSVVEGLPPGAAVCIGFSGGLDSVVLLDLLRRQAAHPISALHVHHGLSPNADAWAQFCARSCAARDVPLTVVRVKVDRNAPEGLEAAARAARYAVYAQRPEPFLALAHHLDDQAETVLLQLLRGTGLKGVAAMPALRALPGSSTQIYRPLLAYPRSMLEAHASAAGLEWIEDESNASIAHDRNYLRHEAAPILDARFPAWREALARFARRAAEAHELLDEQARLDGAAAAGLPVSALSNARRANALRAFLAANDVAMPSEARLAEMAKQLYGARADARVRIDHGGVSLVRHRDVVRIERGLEEIGAWRVEWRGEDELDLGPGRGTVRFERVTGKGLAAGRVPGADWHFMPRAGGEKIRLDPRRPTRTLKNLLQERDVPAWQREKLPLLFQGEQLVWVPGVGIAAEYACGEAEPGILPRWTVAGGSPLC